MNSDRGGNSEEKTQIGEVILMSHQTMH